MKWWEGHINPPGPWTTDPLESLVTSLGYTYVRSQEPEFDATDCRIVIIIVCGDSTGDVECAPFTADEVSRMKQFSADGGILCVMTEHPAFMDLTYGVPEEFEQLMVDLGAQISYGGYIEPESITWYTWVIYPHYLTTYIDLMDYYSCGYYNINSPDVVTLVSKGTDQPMVVLAPIDLD